MSGGVTQMFMLFVVIAVVCHGSWAELQIIDHGGLISNETIISARKSRQENNLDRGYGRPNYETQRPSYGTQRPSYGTTQRPDYGNDNGRPSDAQPIPGTNLKTRTFYKLRMKRFPYGYVTYTQRKNFAHGYRYIQIDNNRDHVQQYERNGEWFRDSMWEFVPVSSEPRYRWYKLRNRGRPREYATWSANEFVTEDSHSSFLILDPNYPGRRTRTEFLFRPVLMKGYGEDGHEDSSRDYYQLKLKENREGVITWSRDNAYATECYYIQVDNSNDDRHMRRYEPGNDRYDDTLFSIVLADRENIDDGEDIEDNHDKFDDH